MTRNDFFEVAPEIFIQRGSGVPPLCLFEYFSYRTPAAVKCSNYGHRPVILSLDNHFAAVLDAREHAPHVTRKISFCDP